jgi:8-oxo-dGTP pyrophosphatase MutT (NUDIX family)
LPQAAVAIVRARAPEPRILLMRRAEREGDSWSGHWSLPGGRRDEADSDLLDTAIRELREECGVRLQREQMCAALPQAIARRRSGPFLLVAPFVFEVGIELPAVPDAREAAAALWLPLRTLLDPNRHSFQRVPGFPAEALFPAITLPGAPLWGFTYRLLADWLEIAPRECAKAGFDVAENILSFLLSQGLTLRRSWRAQAPQDSNESEPLRVAEVNGPIPADAVLEHLSSPGLHAPKANRIDVTPKSIRIYGLAFEQYLIRA